MKLFMKPTAIVLLTLFSFSSAAPMLPEVVTLKGGTNIRVRINQTLSSANAQQGALIMLTVLDAIIVKGVVVVESGAQAEGSVVVSKKAGMIGQKGSIGITVNTVKAVDGTNIPVTAVTSRDGEDKMIISVILGLLCLLGFLMKGGEATLDTNTMIDCRVLSDTDINV